MSRCFHPINEIRRQDDVELTEICWQCSRIGNLESASFTLQIDRQFSGETSSQFALFHSPDLDSSRLPHMVCRGDKAMRQIDADDFRRPTRQLKGGPSD